MTNEPTTGEIVSALRNCPNCDDCLRKDQKCYRNDHDAADRLESQEAQIKQLAEALAYANEWHKESVENATNELRELSGIAGELEKFKAFHERYAEQTSKKYVDDICALTARAESAERERDAAIADIHIAEEDGLCCICSFIGNDIGRTECMEECCFKWRGSEGEKEKV